MRPVTTAHPSDTVRLALVSDAVRVADIQRRSWAADLPTSLAEQALSVSRDEAAGLWATAIDRPPLAQFRVLVAVGQAGVACGFAAVGPSPDPDADPATDALIAEFTIDPDSRRQGHGSRLLNAVVETLRADGFTTATWWMSTTSDQLRTFVQASGWEPDGAHRQIGTDAGISVSEVRLHTTMRDPDGTRVVS